MLLAMNSVSEELLLLLKFILYRFRSVAKQSRKVCIGNFMRRRFLVLINWNVQSGAEKPANFTIFEA